MRQPPRRQPRLKGGREPIWGALDPAIQKAVLADAKRFNCTKSFIVNTAMGLAMGIPTNHYYEIEGKKRPANVATFMPRRAVR